MSWNLQNNSIFKVNKEVNHVGHITERLFYITEIFD